MTSNAYGENVTWEFDADTGNIFDRHANLKYRYGSRDFWARGYFVDTVGKNERMIANYIKNQLEEDYARDQISLEEFTDPFAGERNR